MGKIPPRQKNFRDLESFFFSFPLCQKAVWAPLFYSFHKLHAKMKYVLVSGGMYQIRTICELEEQMLILYVGVISGIGKGTFGMSHKRRGRKTMGD